MVGTDRKKAATGRVRRRWRQRRLLTVLGLVFAASAILRIGAMDFAWADARPPSGENPGQGTALSQISTETMDALRAALADVAQLRASLEGREATLADRERAVEAAQMLVEARLSALEAAEQRLSDLIAVSDGAAESDLDRLTRVYEAMDPDEAAALFAQMEPSFAAGFIARMSPSVSATLMAALAPEQAYAISVILATRNAAAPTLPDAPTRPSENTDS